MRRVVERRRENGAVMIPIEQVQPGTLIFLECGCSALRWLSHPTGAATLVMMYACTAHRPEGIKVRAVSKGTLVSPLTRTISRSA